MLSSFHYGFHFTLLKNGRLKILQGNKIESFHGMHQSNNTLARRNTINRIFMMQPNGLAANCVGVILSEAKDLIHKTQPVVLIG